MKNVSVQNKNMDVLLETFWQTFPPLWHTTRSLVHQTAMEEFGISAAQFHILRRIAEGQSSVSALADCMHLSRPNISRSVDELFKLGLVERGEDTRDRRNVVLILTPTGRNLIKNLHSAIGEKMKMKFSQLDSEETTMILFSLKALLRIFNKQENS